MNPPATVDASIFPASFRSSRLWSCLNLPRTGSGGAPLPAYATRICTLCRGPGGFLAAFGVRALRAISYRLSHGSTTSPFRCARFAGGAVGLLGRGAGLVSVLARRGARAGTARVRGAVRYGEDPV